MKRDLIQPQTKPAAKRGWLSKAELFRQSRMLHAYLSAFAFLALIFFAFTGLLLNHPKWLEAGKPGGEDRAVTIPKTELTVALATKEPARSLADAVGRQTALRGAFKSGEVIDNEANIRLEGVTGKSDLLVNLDDGTAEVTVQRADVATMIRDLHRGKNSGAVWSWIIDISAVIVLLLSLLGYILFFNLRFRLVTSLKLTAISLLTMGAIFYAFVP